MFEPAKMETTKVSSAKKGAIPCCGNQAAFDATFVELVGAASREASFRTLAEAASAWLALNDD